MSSPFRIKNGVGTVTLRGKAYAKGDWVPIPNILKGLENSREKLWGSDSGRALSGNFKGTLTGVYPKEAFTISGTGLNYKDVQAIVILFDQQQTECKYWDDRSAALRTAEFYFDSVKVTKKRLDVDNPKNNRYDSISITAVPIDKYKK